MAKSTTYKGMPKPYGKSGHFDESRRHALQARGIRTGRFADSIAFVKYGYGDDFGLKVRSIDFKTEVVPTEEAQALARVVKQYNEYYGEKIANAMEQFKGRVEGWQFGREGSVVLYVHLPHWTNQQEEPPGSEPQRISPEVIQKLKDELRVAFVDVCHADEFDDAEFSDHIVRIWWD
jgi:hypothetical protein